MLGFGVMDQTIMLMAGQQIEVGIGAALGLSTLAAAGIGQIFSDVSGVFSGGAVDAMASRLKLQPHQLSQQQLTLPAARGARLLGQAVGVASGCMLGLCCLFFIDADQLERERRLEELNQMFDLVEVQSLETVERVIGADLAVLWIHDTEEGKLLARVMSKEGSDKSRYDAWLDWSTQKVEICMETGEPLALFSRSGLGGSSEGGGGGGGGGGRLPPGGAGRLPGRAWHLGGRPRARNLRGRPRFRARPPLRALAGTAGAVVGARGQARAGVPARAEPPRAPREHGVLCGVRAGGLRAAAPGRP